MNADKYIYDTTDSYLRFDGPVKDSTPRELIPFIDTIRKESEWQKAGFKIKKDKHGNHKPFMKKGLCFGWRVLVSADPIELKAIETGKKCSEYPTDILLLVRQGCTYDDFVYVSEDVRAYCEAYKWYEQKQYEKALHQIKRAFELKPDQMLYADLFFEIRLILGDKSTIDDEINYYNNDMDSKVDRAYKWVKFLVDQKDYNKASEVIHKVNSAIDNLIMGKTGKRRYWSQSVTFYQYDKEKFNKKIASLQKRIENSQKSFSNQTNLIS